MVGGAKGEEEGGVHSKALVRLGPQGVGRGKRGEDMSYRRPRRTCAGWVIDTEAGWVCDASQFSHVSKLQLGTALGRF